MLAVSSISETSQADFLKITRLKNGKNNVPNQNLSDVNDFDMYKMLLNVFPPHCITFTIVDCNQSLDTHFKIIIIIENQI